MTAARILNQAQAEAVYSTICALNNVHMRACDLRFGNAIVQMDFNGTVRVIGTAVVDDERYADDSAFATAYGLNSDAEQAEPVAQSKCPGGAACGWDDESKMGDICRVCGEQVPF